MGEGQFSYLNQIEPPYSYHILPFCNPFDGLKDMAENPSNLFMGDMIESSPYYFQMNVNKSKTFLCNVTFLGVEQLKLLKHRIINLYQVSLMLDNLLAIWYTKRDNISL